MGLACAHHLVKTGAKVTVLEAGPRMGGMSVTFDFNGLDIERFFHFICRTDYDYFALLDELGIRDALKWKRTRMGLFHQGRLYPWGEPFALLKFPNLSLLTKLRYGLQVMITKQRKHFDDLENTRARDWLERWLGKSGYQTLWKQLFALKFYEHQDNLSAAWIAARIQRVAHSRSSLLHEELGYLEGCTQTLINALEASLTASGATLITRAQVQRVCTANNKITGVEVNGEVQAFDQVISTIPLPYVPDMIPDLPAEWATRIRSIMNVGVSTIILKLKHPLTPNFWTNITDESIPIPGIIEYGNLNPLTVHTAYVPCYMPQTHPKYQWTLEQFMEELLPVFGRINPEFKPDWVIDAHLSRYHFAQTVCVPGFAQFIPPMSGLIDGLFIADTASYYPQDRSITESVRVGRVLAELATHS
jgi:protoporphyrinogen oxidase